MSNINTNNSINNTNRNNINSNRNNIISNNSINTYSNTNRNNITNNIPVFNKEQLEYLNRVFPENTDVLELSSMYYRAGQRQVLYHIEHLIEQARKRTQEM